MEPLSTAAGRLYEDLSRVLDEPRPSNAELERIYNRVARLLLRAWSDDAHPLTVQQVELAHRCKLERAGELYREPPPAPDSVPTPEQPPPPPPTPATKIGRDPHRHLFMPHPGAGDPTARRLWPLQLLLQTAARAPAHSEALAERLRISVTSMRRAADEAAQGSSIGMWSRRQYIERLMQAVERLKAPEPLVPFRLEGQEFVHMAGARIRLSPQEAVFLQTLVNRAGQAVTRSELHGAGVRDSTQVKNRLVAKLRKHDIELQITAKADVYTLPTSVPAC